MDVHILAFSEQNLLVALPALCTHRSATMGYRIPIIYPIVRDIPVVVRLIKEQNISDVD